MVERKKCLSFSLLSAILDLGGGVILKEKSFAGLMKNFAVDLNGRIGYYFKQTDSIANNYRWVNSNFNLWLAPLITNSKASGSATSNINTLFLPPLIQIRSFCLVII
jgi:hypothetical protein